MPEKPEYKDFTDDDCPRCGKKTIWFHFYTTYCHNCDYEYHDHEAEADDYKHIQAERDFIFREAGGYDNQDWEN